MSIWLLRKPHLNLLPFTGRNLTGLFITVFFKGSCPGIRIVLKITQRTVCFQDDLFSCVVQTQSLGEHLKLMPNTWNCTQRLPLGIQLYGWSCSCMHTVGFQRVKLRGKSFIQMETSASVPKQIKLSDFSMKMNSS